MKRFSAGSISLYILLFLTSFLTAARSGELTEITVSSTSRNDWRLTLHILGTVPIVHETKNSAGLMIFDFPALKSTIPNRAAPEDNSAVRELRWSQFSFDPLIFRLVLMPSPLWQCSHLNSMKSIEISCEKQIPQGLPLARMRGISLFTPLDGFTVQQIIEHSIGYLPKDIVRDGLPHFGSLRDDWSGKTARKHKGLDIYTDKTNVIAAASGTVIKTGIGVRAGSWMKIDHGQGVETVYVHLKNSLVHSGQQVVQGQKIARIDGPTGNAQEPQLHFEIKLDGTSVDPMPSIRAGANPEVEQQIEDALKDIPRRKQIRDKKIEKFLKKH